ncbi:InlB B-repeat-containing protein [Bifidobacterium olomucense]|nr:InlB B-repeat-containing protein [Bifidobacterium sp. DSM 109959]
MAMWSRLTMGRRRFVGWWLILLLVAAVAGGGAMTMALLRNASADGVTADDCYVVTADGTLTGVKNWLTDDNGKDHQCADYWLNSPDVFKVPRTVKGVAIRKVSIATPHNWTYYGAKVDTSEVGDQLVSFRYGPYQVGDYTPTNTKFDFSKNPNLEELVVHFDTWYDKDPATIDLSHNPKLKYLDLSESRQLNSSHSGEMPFKLSDLSANPLLETLDVTGVDNLHSVGGPGSDIVISGLKNLKTLYVGSNRELTTLDVSNNPALQWLGASNGGHYKWDDENWDGENASGDISMDGSGNSVSDLASLDVTHNPELVHLNISGNSDLHSIDLTKNPKLEFFDASMNLVNGCAGLNTKLDTSQNPELKVLSLHQTCVGTDTSTKPWTNLWDTSKNTKLERLAVGRTGTRIFDLSKNPALTRADIERNWNGSNNVAQYDFTNNPNLEVLLANDSGPWPDNYIDVTKLPKLKYLDVSGNDLTKIDFSQNPLLKGAYPQQGNMSPHGFIEANDLRDFVVGGAGSKTWQVRGGLQLQYPSKTIDPGLKDVDENGFYTLKLEDLITYRNHDGSGTNASILGDENTQWVLGNYSCSSNNGGSWMCDDWSGTRTDLSTSGESTITFDPKTATFKVPAGSTGFKFIPMNLDPAGASGWPKPATTPAECNDPSTATKPHSILCTVNQITYTVTIANPLVRVRFVDDDGTNFEGKNGNPTIKDQVLDPQDADHDTAKRPTTDPVNPNDGRTGKVFDGWWTKASGGSKYDFTTPVKQNLTLYAHWVDAINDAPSDCAPVIIDGAANSPLGDGTGSVVASKNRVWLVNGDGTLAHEVTGFKGTVENVIGHNPLNSGGVLVITDKGVWSASGLYGAEKQYEKTSAEVTVDGKSITGVKGVAGDNPLDYGVLLYTDANKAYVLKSADGGMTIGDPIEVTGYTGTITNVTGGNDMHNVSDDYEHYAHGYMLTTTTGVWLVDANGKETKVTGTTGSITGAGDFPLTSDAISIAYGPDGVWLIDAKGNATKTNVPGNGDYKVTGSGYVNAHDYGFLVYDDTDAYIIDPEANTTAKVQKLQGELTGATGTSPLAASLIYGKDGAWIIDGNDNTAYRVNGTKGPITSAEGSLPGEEGTSPAGVKYGGSIITGPAGSWVVDGSWNVTAPNNGQARPITTTEGRLTVARGISAPRAEGRGGLVYSTRGAWLVKPDATTIRIQFPSECATVKYRWHEDSTDKDLKTYNTKDKVTSEIPDELVKKGATATQPNPDPNVPTGYEDKLDKFLYWSLDKDGKDPKTGKESRYDFTTPVTGDTTLYAQYSEGTYRVRFFDDDGKKFDGTNGKENIPDQVVPWNTPATQPDPDPKRDDTYEFLGWYTCRSGCRKWDFNTKVTDDTDLYANWQTVIPDEPKDCSPIVTSAYGDSPLGDGGSIIATMNRVWLAHKDGSVDEVTGITGTVRQVIGSEPLKDSGSVIVTDEGVWTVTKDAKATRIKANGTDIQNATRVSGERPLTDGVLVATKSDAYLIKGGKATKVSGPTGDITNVNGTDYSDNLYSLLTNSYPADITTSGWVVSTTKGAWLVAGDGTVTQAKGTTGAIRGSGPYPLSKAGISLVYGDDGVWTMDATGATTKVNGMDGGDYLTAGAGYIDDDHNYGIALAKDKTLWYVNTKNGATSNVSSDGFPYWSTITGLYGVYPRYDMGVNTVYGGYFVSGLPYNDTNLMGSVRGISGLSGELTSGEGDMPWDNGTTSDGKTIAGAIVTGKSGAWVLRSDTRGTAITGTSGRLTVAGGVSSPNASDRGGLVYSKQGAWLVNPDGSTVKVNLPDECLVLHTVKHRQVNDDDENKTEHEVTNANGTIPDQSVIDGHRATQPDPDPTAEENNKAGYTFDGWYTDTTYTTKYDYTKPVTKDVTIYAHWVKAPTATPIRVLAQTGGVILLLLAGAAVTTTMLYRAANKLSKPTTTNSGK